MYKAFGIVSSSGRNIYVDGMQDYRPIGAFSFLGRYRVIDFPISNMTNSNIERIQVYINNKPRSVVEHPCHLQFESRIPETASSEETSGQDHDNRYYHRLRNKPHGFLLSFQGYL